MYRIFLILMGCGMLFDSIYGQNTSLSMLHDGSGYILVKEPGDAPPKQFRISSQALDFFFTTALDEILDSKIRCVVSQCSLTSDDSEMALYQAMLGMSSEQVTQLAQKRFESYENTKENNYDILEQLVHFDDFSPEEVLLLEQNFRQLIRADFENEEKHLKEVLTSEQLQRIAELELVGDREFPTLNPRAYASLGLSEKQQEELTALLWESKTEILEVQLGMIRGMQKIANEVLADYLTPEDTPEDFDKKIKALPKEEIQKIEDTLKIYAEKILQKQKSTYERIVTKINELLTPQQREKYENLKKELEHRQKELIAQQKEKGPVDNSWMDSWNPGDPVPEGAVAPQPPSRFPRFE